MSVAAAIAFTQPGGGGVGSPGFSLLGNVALPVTVSNGTSATGYTYELVDCPDESALFAIKGIVQSGATPTYTFTPDVQGSYLFHIRVSDGFVFADDYRAFIVPELSSGQIVPPFGATPPMVNYSTPLGPAANNARGWATEMENWLRRLDVPLVRLTAGPVILTPTTGFVEFNGGAGITVQLPPANKKPLRRFYYFFNLTNQTNTINPDPTVPDTINGTASLMLVGAKSFTILATDGISNWDVFAGGSTGPSVPSPGPSDTGKILTVVSPSTYGLAFPTVQLSTGQALIDFGAAPGNTIGRVTVTGQTLIGSGSKVTAKIAYADSTDNTADEHLAARIDCLCGNIVAGTGFDIIGTSEQPLNGKFNVNWSWS